MSVHPVALSSRAEPLLEWEDVETEGIGAVAATTPLINERSSPESIAERIFVCGRAATLTRHFAAASVTGSKVTAPMTADR
ncbi:hypothetical protein ABT279_07350 [Amycolatopsis sp. NPDC000673]|uniref:hypothetical protein n=1 Tax=unclassified Amycolatopsis TaxID=2618356 RepID=UPI0033213025